MLYSWFQRTGWTLKSALFSMLQAACTDGQHFKRFPTSTYGVLNDSVTNKFFSRSVLDCGVSCLARTDQCMTFFYNQPSKTCALSTDPVHVITGGMRLFNSTDFHLYTTGQQKVQCCWRTVQIFTLLLFSYFYICCTNFVTIRLDLTIGIVHLESKIHGHRNNARRMSLRQLSYYTCKCYLFWNLPLG